MSATGSDFDNVVYEFGEFSLDVREKELRNDGELVSVPPKEFDTLLILVQNGGHLVEKSDLLRSVWRDTYVEENNLYLVISNLRRALGDSASKPEYIQTIPKRGFRFVATVVSKSKSKVLSDPGAGVADPGEDLTESVLSNQLPPVPTLDGVRAPDGRRWKTFLMVGVLLSLLVTILTIARLRNARGNESGRVEIHSPFDEVEVRRVVKESQVYETLTVYTHPRSFDKRELERYWVPAEAGGKEVKNVEAAVERLRTKGLRYEDGSKLELFEFTYVKLFAPGDYAEVGTIERWYIPTCREDGSRVLDKNVYLGPNAIDYRLKKLGGVWLIDETTVPRPRIEPSPPN